MPNAEIMFFIPYFKSPRRSCPSTHLFTGSFLRAAAGSLVFAHSSLHLTKYPFSARTRMKNKNILTTYPKKASVSPFVKTVEKFKFQSWELEMNRIWGWKASHGAWADSVSSQVPFQPHCKKLHSKESEAERESLKIASPFLNWLKFFLNIHFLEEKRQNHVMYHFSVLTSWSGF